MRRLRWLALLLGCADSTAPVSPLSIDRIPARAFVRVGTETYAVVRLPAGVELRFVSVAAVMTAGDTVIAEHAGIPPLIAAAPATYSGVLVSTVTVNSPLPPGWSGRLRLTRRGHPTILSVTLGWCRPADCAALDAEGVVP